MSYQSPAIPEWQELGIVEDDSAEPEDANITHEYEVDDAS